jgi:hypothetical protein
MQNNLVYFRNRTEATKGSRHSTVPTNEEEITQETLQHNEESVFEGIREDISLWQIAGRVVAI